MPPTAHRTGNTVAMPLTVLLVLAVLLVWRMGTERGVVLAAACDIPIGPIPCVCAPFITHTLAVLIVCITISVGVVAQPSRPNA